MPNDSSGASKESPRYDKLDDAERRQRPTTVRPLTFDDLATPGPTFRNSRHLVPIESVQPGDEQVFAARGARLRGSGAGHGVPTTNQPGVREKPPLRFAEPVIDLDLLSDNPTVRSIVASTTVRARTPLPRIAELLLFGHTPLPDAQTLRNLPSLVRLWAGWAPGKPALALDALPEGLEALGLCRHSLGWGKSASPRFAELTRFSNLRMLTLNDCWPQDTIAALAGLAQLVRLRSNAPLGWSALRACTALEDVAAIRPRLASLRSLKTWTHLRRLTLTGSGVRNLAGMEAFTRLEDLRLVMLTVDDLSPLAGLPGLADIALAGLSQAHDLTPLGTLPSLRRLVMSRAGGEYRDIVHVDSLRPLANSRALEELTMNATVVDDGDLSPLVALKSLRAVRLFGDLGEAVAGLRNARPDIDVTWSPAGAAPGERVGVVFLRPPARGIPSWWIREDLTELFGVPTNADAEERIHAVLAAEAPEVLGRLIFDTESDAVCVSAEREEDARLVANIITRLARTRNV
jgi:hypothetical protein